MPPPNLRTRSPHTTPRSLLWSSEPIQSPPRKDERTQPESRELCRKALPGIVQPVSAGVAPGPSSLCTSAQAALSPDWRLPLGRRCTPLVDRTFPRTGARFFLLPARCKEEALRLKQGEGRGGCWSRSHIRALSYLPTRLWSSLSPASEQELFPRPIYTNNGINLSSSSLSRSSERLPLLSVAFRLALEVSDGFPFWRWVTLILEMVADATGSEGSKTRGRMIRTQTSAPPHP